MSTRNQAVNIYKQAIKNAEITKEDFDSYIKSDLEEAGKDYDKISAIITKALIEVNSIKFKRSVTKHGEFCGTHPATFQDAINFCKGQFEDGAKVAFCEIGKGFVWIGSYLSFNFTRTA